MQGFWLCWPLVHDSHIHLGIFLAFTISFVNAGVLGAERLRERLPTVFNFSSKNGSTNQYETFTIAFLTKFLTNSRNKIFIEQFFFDL